MLHPTWNWVRINILWKFRVHLSSISLLNFSFIRHKNKSSAIISQQFFHVSSVLAVLISSTKRKWYKSEQQGEEESEKMDSRKEKWDKLEIQWNEIASHFPPSFTLTTESADDCIVKVTSNTLNEISPIFLIKLYTNVQKFSWIFSTKKFYCETLFSCSISALPTRLNWYFELVMET